MAIEDIEKSDYQISITNNIVVSDVLSQSQLITAGSLRVKHPLIEDDMLLYGFIGNCEYLNLEDFIVNGMTISFLSREENKFKPTGKIFTKIQPDFKKHILFYELYNELNELKNTHRTASTRHSCWRETDSALRMNYYFFENMASSLPNATSDELYLVCKGFQEGKFKYHLFAPHEVIFVL